MKREHGMIVLAILRHGGGDVVTNPESDTAVESADRLVVVSARDRDGALTVVRAGRPL